MTKCGYADQYQALLPPRCNGGAACDTCVAAWQAAQKARIKKANAGRPWRCSLCRLKGAESTVTCINPHCPAVRNPIKFAAECELHEDYPKASTTN